MTKTLKAVTPHGTFTRATSTDYRYVVVWQSPRAFAVFEKGGKQIGVNARWVKDRGFGVTWHSKQPDPRKYVWDSKATLLGVFGVEA